MQVAADVVFVHVPRTGGTFIRRILSTYLRADPSEPFYKGHVSYEELPARFRGRPSFCVVRNPWDWYVSWYEHAISRGPKLGIERFKGDLRNEKNLLWQSVFRAGAATFDEAVTRACGGEFKHPGGKEMRRGDHDLYSQYLFTLVRPALEREDMVAGRFEDLRGFLLRFFDERGLLTPDLAKAITDDPPDRAVPHGHYRDYYSDDLRDLVGQKARWVIDRYGYEF